MAKFARNAANSPRFQPFYASDSVFLLGLIGALQIGFD